MSERIQFREKLSGILQMAREQKDRIGMKEVEAYFQSDQLNEEQMTLVYDYLLSQKIVVTGYVKKGGMVSEGVNVERKPLTADEQAYLREYELDLEAIKTEKQGEKEQLYKLVQQGEENAKSRLIELYLREVITIAKEFQTETMFFGDLVQEGNVSLMLSMDLLKDSDNPHETICMEIRTGIQALLEEQNEQKKQDERMVQKVNQLNEHIRSLTEELGRKVTVEELALFMDMEEAEILDILKLAGEEGEEEAVGQDSAV